MFLLMFKAGQEETKLGCALAVEWRSEEPGMGVALVWPGAPHYAMILCALLSSLPAMHSQPHTPLSQCLQTV